MECKCNLDHIEKQYSFICRYIKDGDIIMDMGCNTGMHLNMIKDHMGTHGCNIRTVGLDGMTVDTQ